MSQWVYNRRIERLKQSQNWVNTDISRTRSTHGKLHKTDSFSFYN